VPLAQKSRTPSGGRNPFADDKRTAADPRPLGKADLREHASAAMRGWWKSQTEYGDVEACRNLLVRGGIQLGGSISAFRGLELANATGRQRSPPRAKVF